MALKHRRATPEHDSSVQRQPESFNIVELVGRIWGYGGGERYIQQLNALLLDDTASRVHIIYGTEDRGARSYEERVGKGTIVHHPLYVPEEEQASRYVSRSLRYGRELLGICRAEDVDLVHIHFSPFNPISMYSAFLSKLNCVPVILTQHRDVRSFGLSLKTVAMHPIAAVTNRLADKCTGVSLAACAIFKGRGEVIGSVVDTEYFRPDHPDINTEDFIGGNNLEGKFVVAVPARFEEKKGQMDLLQALPIVKKESSGECDPCVVLAGFHKDPAFASRLRRYATENGLEDNVRILDLLDQAGVRNMLAASKGFCLPSHTEALPLSVIEASAMGKPVIATRVGGIPEAVVEDESGRNATGLLVDPQNPAQLAEAILALWRNPELAAMMGVNGREFAVRNFSPQQFLSRVKGFYYDLVSRRG